MKTIVLLLVILASLPVPAFSRDKDVDRNIVLMNPPSISATVSKDCGITDDDAKNILLIELTKNNFKTSGESLSSYLNILINCFEITPNRLYFVIADLSLSVETITIYDMDLQLNSKTKDTGPSFTLAEIWGYQQPGTAYFQNRRAIIEDAIKSTADALIARRIQAVLRIKESSPTEFDPSTAKPVDGNM